MLTGVVPRDARDAGVPLVPADWPSGCKAAPERYDSLSVWRGLLQANAQSTLLARCALRAAGAFASDGLTHTVAPDTTGASQQAGTQLARVPAVMASFDRACAGNPGS